MGLQNIQHKFSNKCCSIRIIEWVREEVENSNGKARERIQAVVLDMSSKWPQILQDFIKGDA
jgi:hypothetical protein